MILSVLPWPEELNVTIPVVSPEKLAEIFTTEHAYEKLQPVMGDETFYIIFTSGTTGVPKGVQISHKNLLSFVNWNLKDFEIEAGMRFLSQAPYSLRFIRYEYLSCTLRRWNINSDGKSSDQ